jgi:hypothetical protein
MAQTKKRETELARHVVDIENAVIRLESRLQDAAPLAQSLADRLVASAQRLLDAVAVHQRGDEKKAKKAPARRGTP